jgi:hypothetical protein
MHFFRSVSQGDSGASLCFFVNAPATTGRCRLRTARAGRSSPRSWPAKISPGPYLGRGLSPGRDAAGGREVRPVAARRSGARRDARRKAWRSSAAVPGRCRAPKIARSRPPSRRRNIGRIGPGARPVKRESQNHQNYRYRGPCPQREHTHTTQLAPQMRGLPKKRGVESEKLKFFSLRWGVPYIAISSNVKTKRKFQMRVLHTTTLPNAAGASAGASVTINHVKISGDGVTPALPSRGYSVIVTPSQANVVCSVSGKSTTGFTITLTPISSSYQIVAGTVDYVVADSGTPTG